MKTTDIMFLVIALMVLTTQGRGAIVDGVLVVGTNDLVARDLKASTWKRAATPSDLGNPVLMRAADRATNVQTNRMGERVHVLTQSLLAGKVVSRMSDGTTVVEEPKRAVTARIPGAIERLDVERARIDLELALINLEMRRREEGSKAMVTLADSIKALASKTEAEAKKPIEEKPKEKEPGAGGKVAVVGGGIAAVAAAAYGLKRVMA